MYTIQVNITGATDFTHNSEQTFFNFLIFWKGQQKSTCHHISLFFPKGQVLFDIQLNQDLYYFK